MKKYPKRKYKPRPDPGYEEFRQKVLKRDKHTCRFPGCRNKNRRWLDVHHIYEYSKYPQYRTDPKYSITICRYHHKLVTGKESMYAPIFINILYGK